MLALIHGEVFGAIQKKKILQTQAVWVEVSKFYTTGSLIDDEQEFCRDIDIPWGGVRSFDLDQILRKNCFTQTAIAYSNRGGTQYFYIVPKNQHRSFVMTSAQ